VVQTQHQEVVAGKPIANSGEAAKSAIPSDGPIPRAPAPLPPIATDELRPLQPPSVSRPPDPPPKDDFDPDVFNRQKTKLR
jgi:hypothetical protein